MRHNLNDFAAMLVVFVGLILIVAHESSPKTAEKQAVYRTVCYLIKGAGDAPDSLIIRHGMRVNDLQASTGTRHVNADSLITDKEKIRLKELADDHLLRINFKKRVP
jgi:hypothetical protein